MCAVFKKGKKSDPANYRPISLTCVASKILVHIIHSFIMKHLNDHNILTDCQHGFRAKRSTEMQLILTLQAIQSSSIPSFWTLQSFRQGPSLVTPKEAAALWNPRRAPKSVRVVSYTTFSISCL